MKKTNIERLFELDDVVSEEANGMYTVPSDIIGNIRVRDSAKNPKNEFEQELELQQKNKKD